MNANTERSYINVSDLSRDEKREIWMRRTGHTVAFLASVVGVTPSVLSRYLRLPDMPAAHHAALVKYGVPKEVLPKAVQRTPGRNPVQPLNPAEPRPC